MNGSYHLNRLYAQEVLKDRLREAEIHRLTRKDRKERTFRLTVGAVVSWTRRTARQATQSLEKLSQVRVAPLHR
jgi:hypothetical protein